MPQVSPSTLNPAPNAAPKPEENGLLATVRSALNREIAKIAPALIKAADMLTPNQNWGTQVDRLHDNQDSVFRRDLQEIKLEGTLSLPIAKIKNLLGRIPALRNLPVLDASVTANLKDQTSHTIRVTQRGSGGGEFFVVRFDKTTMVGLGAEAGAKIDTSQMPKVPGVDAEGKLKKEQGVTMSHAMEYSFKTRADAARAAAILEKVENADLADDYLRRALAATPLTGPAAALMDGGVLPMTNPLGMFGGANSELMGAAGVTQADLDFLNRNLYSQAFGTSGPSRVAAEGKFNLWGIKGPKLDAKLEAGIEGRKDLTVSVRRTFYYQQGGIPPQVVDRMDLAFIATNKEKDISFKGKLPGSQFGQLALDVLDERGSRTVTISDQYTLALGEKLTPQVFSRNFPDKDGKVDVRMTDLKGDQEIRQLVPYEGGHVQGRRDMTRSVWKVDDVPRGQAASIAAALMAGSIEGAQKLAGKKLAHDVVRIDRDGYNVQLPLKVGIDKVVAGEATAARAAGMDDFGSRTPTVAQRLGLKDTPQNYLLMKSRLVVQPMEGINVRSEPNGTKIGAFQGTAFLGTWGETRKDAHGREWTRVVGLTQDDEELTGWIRSDLVRAYPMNLGAMDKVGRENPSLAGYKLIKVKDDDNMWNLAKKHGWDFAELLKANEGHIVNPNRIYRGDSIYVPFSR